MELFKVKIDENTEQTVLEKITESVKKRKKLHIVTLNPEIMLLAKDSKKYRELLNEAEMRTIDGVGLFRAVNKKNRNFAGEIVTGTDLVYSICDLSQELKIRIFFLGGKKGVARESKKKARKLYPACHIVGTIDGVEIDPYKTNTELISKINSAKPDILFVALGAPKQEIWIHNNRKLLSANVMIGVGGALDYLSGNIKRAPKILRKLGGEWLFRLITNPSRFKRIYNATVRFPREAAKENHSK